MGILELDSYLTHNHLRPLIDKAESIPCDSRSAYLPFLTKATLCTKVDNIFNIYVITFFVPTCQCRFGTTFYILCATHDAECLGGISIRSVGTRRN